MTDLDDFDLDETRAAPPEPEGSGWGLRVGLAAGLLLLAGGVAAVFMLLFRHPAAPKLATPASTTAGAPLATVNPTAPVPPLDGSDDFVRELAQGLSSHPQLALWLGAKELVRKLAAVVDNVAAGDNPSPHLPLLAPKPPFAVVTKRGRSVVDPRNHARWDAFGAGVAAIDAAEAARIFSRLEPLFEAAWRELGHPEPFRDGVARATAALLAVPLVEAEVPVVPVVRAVPLYEYADRKLESLTPAQKQLLRMGPSNVARIQAKLREVRAALGRP
jgi:hypothetical protein